MKPRTLLLTALVYALAFTLGALVSTGKLSATSLTGQPPETELVAAEVAGDPLLLCHTCPTFSGRFFDFSPFFFDDTFFTPIASCRVRVCFPVVVRVGGVHHPLFFHPGFHQPVVFLHGQPRFVVFHRPLFFHPIHFFDDCFCPQPVFHDGFFKPVTFNRVVVVVRVQVNDL